MPGIFDGLRKRQDREILMRLLEKQPPESYRFWTFARFKKTDCDFAARLIGQRFFSENIVSGFAQILSAWYIIRKKEFLS